MTTTASSNGQPLSVWTVFAGDYPRFTARRLDILGGEVYHTQAVIAGSSLDQIRKKLRGRGLRSRGESLADDDPAALETWI